MFNNKGFTLVELLGVIVILSILLVIATFSYSKYLKASKDKAFELAVNSFEDATNGALDDCASGRNNSFCERYSIPDVGETITIQLSEIVNNYYIEPIKSPYNKSDECSGTIEVTRKAVEIKHNGKSFGVDDSNIDLCFKTCLKCSNKESAGCYSDPSCN